MVSAPARRRQVAFICERGVSQRRACALMSVIKSTLRGQLTPPGALLALRASAAGPKRGCAERQRRAATAKRNSASSVTGGQTATSSLLLIRQWNASIAAHLLVMLNHFTQRFR